MNDKPKMKFRVVSGRNPKTGGSISRPQITDRETYYLDQVVRYALNAGYVRGQFHDMRGALNGFIEAIQQLGRDGKAVNLNDWLRVHGELTGTVGETRQLDGSNEYHVVITALKELKRNVNEFAWTNVDDSGETVKVSTLMSVGGTPGFIAKTQAIIATGRNLQFNAEFGDSVTIAWKEGDEDKSVSIVPVESDYSHMKFDWPTALADVPVNTELTFSFRTRAGIEGAGVQVNTKTATLTAAS